MTLIKHISLVFGLVALLTQPSWGAALAGHVILTKGSVTAATQDGENRTLKRRSQIFNGDIIKTGPAGSVQIRFVDKALMTIKASSEMNIESYLLSQQGNDEQKEQVIMSLVKGGFRTITGTIGKGDKNAYKVNTPAASIGIRGTNYEVQQESDGGFVMGVYSGGIQVENESGTIELGEGADFNFTRVKPKSSPKGLLAPPASLAANTATEQSEDESEQTADNKTQEEGDDSSSEDNETAENNDAPKENTNSESLSDFASTVTNVNSDISNAIDNKLTTTIQNTADKVEEELIDQGVIGTFDFKDPYKGIDTTNTNNPFDKNIISDQQYALAESGRIGLIAVPVNFNFGAEGTPDVPLAEAMLASAKTINASNIGNINYTGSNTKISINYDVLTPVITNGVTTYVKEEYRIEIPVDTQIEFVSELMNTFDDSYNTNIKVFKETENGSVDVTSSVSAHINYQLIDESATGEYTLSITSAANSGDFVSEIELDIHSSNTSLEQSLYAQIGSADTSSDEEWRSSSEIELIIANGSWDATGNKPIMLEMESDDDGNRIAVIRKPTESNKTASSLLEYSDVDLFGQIIPATCGSGESGNPKPCDIQVENAGGRSNISWGIWFTEPGEGILFDEINEDGTTESHTENEILAFWIAAERADINQLTGSASFSATNLDCTNASQCIGFADDGFVRDLNAQFDVNFNSGAITNGNLNLQTATDLDSAAISTWDVNFSGSMMKDGVKHPEFSTESLNGKINGTDANIVGNIGGIFVKPGDKFAGAYNLGAIDSAGEDHKHAAGVFTMDKK
ncbi:FecR family protein [Pseudomonas sp. HK3]